MANYVFYDGSIAGAAKRAVTTPGDLSTMLIRRGEVDGALQALTAGTDEAHAIPVYAGEIVLGVIINTITAEGTANCAVDIGIDGGTEFGADVACTTADTVTSDVANWAPYYVAANGHVTLLPNNAVDLDSGKIEVIALITKGFDKQ